MNGTVVEQVEGWFKDKCQYLSESFPEVRFRLMYAADKTKGKVTIELGAVVAAAMITFWNKGDVEALVLNKTTKQDLSLDDRTLAVDDDVPSLLQSYVERFQAFIKEIEGSPTFSPPA
jgi:hypothetical protein